MIAIQILANQLISQNEDFIVHEGYVKFPDNSIDFQHTWIEKDGGILDPTAEQFNTNTDYLSEIQYIPHRKFNPSQYMSHCEKHPLKESDFYIRKESSNVV